MMGTDEYIVLLHCMILYNYILLLYVIPVIFPTYLNFNDTDTCFINNHVFALTVVKLEAVFEFRVCVYNRTVS